MNLKPQKQQILEALWFSNKPMKPAAIAKELNMDFPSCMMHLLGLLKKGYVYCPQRGIYAITEEGKHALGFPKLEKDFALRLLTSIPLEKAFHFYVGIGQYLGEYATNLPEFCEKIQKIETRSIEFHMLRKDFENWFVGLGDLELAKRLNTVRELGLAGEELRRAIYENVKSRCDELLNLVGKA